MKIKDVKNTNGNLGVNKQEVIDKLSKEDLGYIAAEIKRQDVNAFPQRYKDLLESITDVAERKKTQIELTLHAIGDEKLFDSILAKKYEESPESRAVLGVILSIGNYDQKLNAAYSILTGAELIDPKK